MAGGRRRLVIAMALPDDRLLFGRFFLSLGVSFFVFLV